MSDRYRPPTGPRSTRGGYKRPPPGASSRYNERDNYRPKIHGPAAQAGQPPQVASNASPSSAPSSSTTERPRPTGPSYRPTGPSGSAAPGGPSGAGGVNGKRNFPSGPGGYKPDKRRQTTLTYKPKPFYKSSYSNVPKGPAGPKPFNGRPIPNKTPTGPGLKPRIKQPYAPIKKLPKSQAYSIQVSKPYEIYQRIQQVGEGTYGKVYKAKNSLTNQFVALKKLRLESEREGFPITAMREIKLLQSFDHENIVGLLEMMIEHNQIYMVLDYLDHDLTGLLTHPDLKLEECHRKYLFKQLMEGLNYLHKKRVIHRDIKGSNILLDNKGTVKIADFGLARTMKLLNTGESPDYTNRVITIWYRPPELLLGATDYGREVDIWGVGCLLIELYSKNATFQGTEELSQLFKIFDLMGTPTIESWPNIENLPWFEMLKPKVNKISKFSKEYKPIMSEQSFDLAEKLLTLNPKKRLTASEALNHAYFTKDPKPEPLYFLKDVKGEWHEFETKKRRRQERKKLQDAQKQAQFQERQ
ncbi:Pkinase-domain-containing protein, partial [Hyphopichia burtonii NRRL Y-1933]